MNNYTYNCPYKDIVGIWYKLALCAYAGKTNSNDCSKYAKFLANQDLKNKFLKKT
jgi:hypothetical protein